MNFSKVKVMIVNPSMNIGGVETYLMNVLRNIDRSKYEIIFLTYSNETYVHQKEILRLGGRIVRIRHPKKSGHLKYFKELLQIIKLEQPEVVHANTQFNSIYIIVAAKIFGITNIVVHSHLSYKKKGTSATKRIRNWLSIPIINNLSSYQLAASTDASLALFGNKRATIIKNGINVKDFKYSETSRSATREKLGIGKKTHVIMHSARFHPDKNHIFLLSIFKAYLELWPDSILLLLGDGELREQVESYAKENSLDEKIIFMGYQTESAIYYNAADIFVLPSFSEGLGIVLIEAQANGLYCVASQGVPLDANITGNIEYLSLSSSDKEWANVIKGKIGKRKPTAYEEVLANGYDALESVHLLEDIYNGK